MHVHIYMYVLTEMYILRRVQPPQRGAFSLTPAQAHVHLFPKFPQYMYISYRRASRCRMALITLELMLIHRLLAFQTHIGTGTYIPVDMCSISGLVM